MERTIQSGALGIKVMVSGRINGAEISRRFSVMTGRPLAYVIASMWDGGNIGHYAREHPRVLIDGRPRRAVFLNGVSYESDLGYRPLLEGWEASGEYPVTYIPTVSRPGDPSNGGWSGRTGRVESIVGPVCDELGLTDQVVSPAEPSAYLYVRGALRRLPAAHVLGVPTDMEALAASGIVSAEGVTRAAADIDAVARNGVLFLVRSDETILRGLVGDLVQFAGRRLFGQPVQRLLRNKLSLC